MVFRTPFFLPWVYPSLLWKIPTDRKEIYLTFDDGPIPGPTEFVLEQLEKFKAKGTFFCIGDNVSKYPAIFRQVVEGGHAIGNHTFHHMKGWSHTTAAYLNDVRMCDDEFAKNASMAWGIRKPALLALFRPPYGRIRPKQIRSLPNYKIVMWDVLTHDYSNRLTPQECLRGSINAVRPGSIVVFHDSIKAEKNLTYVLPHFLDYFAGQGYAFKPISNS